VSSTANGWSDQRGETWLVCGGGKMGVKKMVAAGRLQRWAGVWAAGGGGGFHLEEGRVRQHKRAVQEALTEVEQR